MIAVQDDKLDTGGRKALTQLFTPHEFAAFLEGAKNGDFDKFL